MKGLLLRAVASLLLVAMAVSLCACGDNGEIVQSGIEISSDDPISQETDQRAVALIFSLLKYYFEKTTEQVLPSNFINELNTQASKIQEVTKKHPISSRQYEALLDVLERDGEAVIDGLTSYPPSYERAKQVYKDLSGMLGDSYVGSTVYSAVIYFYDYRYGECIRNYEKYGYDFLLEDANALLEEKTVLINHVGERSFATAIRALFFISDLISSGAYEREKLNSFTNEEILIFVDYMDLSLKEVSQQGWELLLSYAADLAKGGYASKILAQAKASNDLPRLAAAIKSAVALCELCKDRLGEQDAEYIRNMDFNGLLVSVFNGLDSEGWSLFEEAASALPGESYSAIAAEEFGEDFISYRENITVYTLDELKASVNEEHFFKTLEGYIAGISPALSYLMNYD